MRLRVIAVGTRMSAWVDAACNDYSRRLRGADAIELVEIPVARRHGAGDAKRAVRLEAERILALLEAREYVVALEERGRSFTTLQLSAWLAERRTQGDPLSFIIGGPDGLGHERPRCTRPPPAGTAARAGAGVGIAQAARIAVADRRRPSHRNRRR